MTNIKNSSNQASNNLPSPDNVHGITGCCPSPPAYDGLENPQAAATANSLLSGARPSFGFGAATLSAPSFPLNGAGVPAPPTFSSAIRVLSMLPKFEKEQI